MYLCVLHFDNSFEIIQIWFPKLNTYDIHVHPFSNPFIYIWLICLSRYMLIYKIKALHCYLLKKLKQKELFLSSYTQWLFCITINKRARGIFLQQGGIIRGKIYHHPSTNWPVLYWNSPLFRISNAKYPSLNVQI